MMTSHLMAKEEDEEDEEVEVIDVGTMKPSAQPVSSTPPLVARASAPVAVATVDLTAPTVSLPRARSLPSPMLPITSMSSMQDDPDMVTIDVHDAPAAKRRDPLAVMAAIAGESSADRHGSRFLRALHTEATQMTPIVHNHGHADEKVEGKRRTQNALLAVTSLNEGANISSAINALPLPIQVAFRVKVLGLFTLQLLCMGLLTITLTYSDALVAFAKDGGAVAGSVVLSLLALFLLYLGKYSYPFNFGLLGLFTVVQSFAVSALGAHFETHAAVFSVVFTFFVLVFTTALSTRTRQKRTADGGSRTVLLSTPVAGMVAYALVAIVSCLIYAGQGDTFMSGPTFAISLLFSLGVIMWFAYDASCMYQIMSPDEYMQGVIFFYTDLVLLVVFLLVMGVCIAACDGGTPMACFGNCGPLVHVDDEDDDAPVPGTPGQVDAT
ncbi:hypothetical protein ACHHYP_15324 [Achlya hypogyna]|uniref:Uncharacterized protein n=1 Tax=Achlya hypogyna TaxID=1202772 RepID=A0A1V9YB39_ACHHY|nr:hypothetical protein ACHHYP_15324 [Achlya hypogyna]